MTADATSAGVVTVASTTPFYPGQRAWLSDNAGLSVHVQVVKVPSSTTMTVRKIPDSGSSVQTLTYSAGSDVSAFKSANAARIDAPAQVVQVNQPTFSKLDSIA